MTEHLYPKHEFRLRKSRGRTYARAARLFAVTLVAMILSGCGGRSCVNQALLKQIAQLEASFRIAEGNLARGYALHVSYEEVSKPYSVKKNVCVAYDSSGDCTRVAKRTETEYRVTNQKIEKPVAIDVQAEGKKMDELSYLISDLRRTAEQERRACLAKK